MARKNIKYSFNKAEISLDNGKYTITEINKDNSADYNLSSILNRFIGISNISLSIGADDDVPEIVEE